MMRDLNVSKNYIYVLDLYDFGKKFGRFALH
jgi:hypothetical protein